MTAIQRGIDMMACGLDNDVQQGVERIICINAYPLKWPLIAV